tara:strand:- start:2417 stop:2596 length:180 start_codon:yes stop_codon:yes gene_type:complete
MVIASRFYQFIGEDKSTMPTHLLERDKPVDFLCGATHETEEKKTADNEALWAVVGHKWR